MNIKKNMNELKNELIYKQSIKKLILDTDTYNEIDDQFALAYAMLSTESVDLISVNAAPFLNNRSTSPADGMEKSYNEIQNIMKLTDPNKKIPSYRGSVRFMSADKKPIESDAAQNIINTAMNSDEMIYVAAIGAITNVASAILMEPKIIDKITVIWLGGNANHVPDTREFNMWQDIPSAQVVMESGVNFIQIPCRGVCDYLATTIPELEAHLKGKNALCDYLVEIVNGYTSNPFAWSKVIWDVSGIAVLALPKALDMVVIPTHVPTQDGIYSFDDSRHLMIYTRGLNRDMIFADLFKKLSK